MQPITNSTKEAIKNCLSQDKGLQVFQYYGFEPNNRKPQRENPFRQERTSSFFVNWYNNAFRFKDFGDTDIKGNAWDFVKRYHNLTDSADVWAMLANIYGISRETSDAVGERSKKIQQKNDFARLSNDKATLISINFRDFSDKELDFWWKKGEIDLPALQEANVKAVESFKIQYEKEGGKISFYERKNIRFVFAFEIVAGECYKLYQPKELYRAFGKGKTSFLPNLAPAKAVFGENYRYSFGLDTLREGEAAILCAGEADCLALKAKSYNAFTLGAEEARVSTFIEEKLTQKGVKMNDVRVLYDTDFTGYKHSRLLKKHHKMQVLTLPKLACQMRKDAPKPAENDLCDYIGKFGWDSDLELCLAQKPFSKRGFVLPAVPQFGVEKYLSAHRDLLTNFFLQNKRVQLMGDAGLGKTHTLLREVAPAMPNPVLFLVPYAIQVSQIESEYLDMGHELTCFHNKPPQEEEELRFAQVNVCTYDRAKQLFEKNPDFEIWVDESHLLTLAYPYRKQAIDAVLEMMQASPRTVLLSATPDYQFTRKEGYQLITFRRARNPLFVLEQCAYQTKQERDKLLGELLTRNTQAQGVTVVRLNDKKLALSCRDALVEMGLYEKKEIDFVFSMEEKNFYTRTHAALVQTGKIPDDVRLLFVSSCFDCGINVYNEHIERLILFETQSHDNSLDVAVQVSQRFRNLERLPITIVKREWKNSLPEAQKALFKWERQTQALAELQLQTVQLARTKQQENVQKLLERYKKPAYLKLNQDLSKPYRALQWSKERQQFEINRAYLRCVNEQFLQEYLGIAEYYEALEKELHLKICPAIDTQTDLAAQFCETMRASHTKRKNWLAQTTEELLPHLEEQKQQAFFETLYMQSKDIHLKENILAHTPADLHHIREQQDSNPTPVSADMEGALAVGAKHTVAKRYLQLKDLLFSPAQTQILLRENPKDTGFNALMRDVGNQIKLAACEQLGEDVWLLAQDTLLQEELRALKFLHHSLQNLPTPTAKEQKNTAKYTQEVEEKKKLYDEALEKKRLLEDTIAQLAQKPRKRVEVAVMKRKLDPSTRKIERAKAAWEEAIEKLEGSRINAWELNELNQYLQALQGGKKNTLRINVRLAQSLCHTQIFRRKTWDNETKTYAARYYLNIEGMKTLQSTLQSFGLPTEASLAYENSLQRQLQADVAQFKQALLEQNQIKNDRKVPQKTIVYYLQSPKPVLNEHGYPADWD